jgi:hypothetical protein
VIQALDIAGSFNPEIHLHGFITGQNPVTGGKRSGWERAGNGLDVFVGHGCGVESNVTLGAHEF